ncbi:MAG: hypothetical protein ACLRXQ_11290 [Phascolarctobacterium faecium]
MGVKIVVYDINGAIHNPKGMNPMMLKNICRKRAALLVIKVQNPSAKELLAMDVTILACVLNCS